MRFLIGLMFGAGAILLVTGGTVPGTADEWRQRATEWLDRLAVTVGDALELPQGAEPPVERVAVPSLAKRELPRTETPLPEAQTPLPEARSELAEPARQPIPRPPDPLPLEADPAAQPEPELASAPEPDLLRRTHPGPESSPPEPMAAAVPAPARVPGGRSQAVWAPFHSEMSASGFAARLSESLDHPFEVERQGPGRYQVVFAYASEDQRAELLDQAAVATGLPL